MDETYRVDTAARIMAALLTQDSEMSEYGSEEEWIKESAHLAVKATDQLILELQGKVEHVYRKL